MAQESVVELTEADVPGIHPGKPNPLYQALSSAYWDGLRLLAYTSGNNLVILSIPGKLRQTLYLDRDGGAVEIEESTGRIAVVSGPKVLIYRPSTERDVLLREWSLEWTIHLDLDDSTPTGVNWGTENEIFISGKTISLWGFFKNGPTRLWRKQLSVPAILSAFSFDAYLAATVGKNDRLVKVWRRFSYDSTNADFDFSYLPHPRAVTGLRWRRPFSRAQSVENILYTICADGILRIWAPTDSIESSYMQMWASIDLFDVMPRQSPSDLRYTFLIDNKDFTRATESAVRNAKDDTNSEKLNYLIEIASKNPDVAVVFDQHGRFAALGIENIGSRARKAFSIFDIAYDDNPIKDFPTHSGSLAFIGFGASTPEEPDFALMIHDLNNGVIRHYYSAFANLLYSGEEQHRLRLKHVWTGHYKSVQSLTRTADGKALLSSSNHAENIIWKPKSQFGKVILQPVSIIMAPDKVQRAVILLGGRYVITLQRQDLVLWDCARGKARRLSSDPIIGLGKKQILNLFLLPQENQVSEIFHVLAIFNDRHGLVWEVKVPKRPSLAEANGNGEVNGEINGYSKKPYYLRKFTEFTFPLPEGDELTTVLTVDPVGWNATLNSFDTYARDVINSISKEGVVRSWTAKLANGVQWLETAKVETGIREFSLAKGSSMKKLAIVDENSTRLTIWDIGEKHLEFEAKFKKTDIIRDLDWTTTPDSQSILAVGFQDRVVLYCQLRFDYTKELPAWAPFRQIPIRKYTPRVIGDSIWLDDGTLVIGVGNQLFTHDKRIDSHKAIKNLHIASHKLSIHSIFDIVSVLNGPLPVYHPQFVAQSIFVGKSSIIKQTLVNLLKALKFSVPTDNNVADITSSLGMDVHDFLKSSFAISATAAAPTRTKDYSRLFSNEPYDVEDISTFNEHVATSLNSYLTQVSLPYLTSHQQISLAAMIESLGQVEEHRRSLDENGVRYLLAFRLFTLHKDSMTQMPYRDHNWAFHSEMQEILVDLVSKTFNSRMVWSQARECGIFVWLKSPESVKKVFENLARTQYTRSEPKDPVVCTLFYLALKKKQILLGLWRIASGHKEQQVMLKFLANNFADPRWKTAALKNAYVLLGKQRYEYAAAFFLLGDSLKDAVNICVRHLNDIQLAIAISRVYEGDDGAVFLNLLKNEVLPLAYNTGDRWLASWAHWNLKRQDLALKCIISSTVQDESNFDSSNGQNGDLERKMFFVEDPVLVVLYQQIRDSLRRNIHNVIGITPEMETEFVLHIAKLYDRMGCDVLALDLTKNWRFIDRIGTHDVL
ncbi:RAVE protein 1 C terminal-domain-containing protein [Lipomyces japonicus]|uniref:RAVE protein 1 C terminal-domain-containing protein n=1 Tax=Lipomyces japonicus TaxID=56871 RepID=UPI0034CE4BA5